MVHLKGLRPGPASRAWQRASLHHGWVPWRNHPVHGWLCWTSGLARGLPPALAGVLNIADPGPCQISLSITTLGYLWLLAVTQQVQKPQWFLTPMAWHGSRSSPSSDLYHTWLWVSSGRSIRLLHRTLAWWSPCRGPAWSAPFAPSGCVSPLGPSTVLAHSPVPCPGVWSISSLHSIAIVGGA